MTTSSDRPRRPNILFCFADDWGRYASCYAKLHGPRSLSALISTPHIDRIAGEGALFSNALVPAPSCTPCRSSVLSGRYFWQTRLGAILSGAVWDRTIPSFPLMLEAAGYHIGFSDKVWSPGTPIDDPYGGLGRRYQASGADFGTFSQHACAALDRGSDREAAKAPLLAEVRGNFRSFLAARTEDRPFCYWWGPTNTHRVWERGSGKRLWDLDPDALRGRLPEFFPDVHDVRQDIADYLGECMAFDRGVGELLRELEERGMLDDTLVVASGDHGIPGFPRAKCNLYGIGVEVALCARLPGRIPPGRVIDDMINLMDLAPTFCEAAGVAPDGGMAGRSLWPLLGSRASGQLDPSRSAVITGRERHVATARDRNLPYPHRALRTRDHLYIVNFEPERWPMGDPKGLDDPSASAPPYEVLASDTLAAYADLDASPTKAWMILNRADPSVREAYALGFGKRPAEELYDLRRDPDQMHNLAGGAEHDQLRATLRERLFAELRAQRDPRVCEADCRFERSPYTDWPCPAEGAAERLAEAATIDRAAARSPGRR
jgi:arylsulfatase A-like enzyme